MNELQRLDHELDFANAAAAEFHIALKRAQAHDVSLDSPFDVRNFVEQVRRRTARINKRLMLPKEFVGQFAIPRDAARLDQRHALPGFAKAGIIIFHAFERAREWTGAAFGTQAKIDTEKRAFRIAHGKYFQNLLGQSIKPLVIRNSRRDLAFLAVKKDKIDIGTMIELAAAKFAESQGGKLRCRSAKCLSKLRIAFPINFADADFSQLR